MKTFQFKGYSVALALCLVGGMAAQGATTKSSPGARPIAAPVKKEVPLDPRIPGFHKEFEAYLKKTGKDDTIRERGLWWLANKKKLNLTEGPVKFAQLMHQFMHYAELPEKKPDSVYVPGEVPEKDPDLPPLPARDGQPQSSAVPPAPASEPPAPPPATQPPLPAGVGKPGDNIADQIGKVKLKPVKERPTPPSEKPKEKSLQEVLSDAVGARRVGIRDSADSLHDSGEWSDEED